MNQKTLLSAALVSLSLGTGGCAMMCGACSPKSRSAQQNPCSARNPCAARNPCEARNPCAAR